MQPDRDDRYQSMAQFSMALKEVRDTPYVRKASDESSGPKTKKRKSRGMHPAALAGMILATVGVAIGLAMILFQPAKPTPTPDQSPTVESPKAPDSPKSSTQTPETPAPTPEIVATEPPVESPPPDPSSAPETPPALVPNLTPEPLPDGWTDGFADLDPTSATSDGNWQRRGPGIELVSETDGFPKLELQASPQEPTKSASHSSDSGKMTLFWCFRSMANTTFRFTTPLLAILRASQGSTTDS